MISEHDSSVIVGDGDGIGADYMVSMLSENILERLMEICGEDGIAVLEMADTGDVFVARNQDDGSCMLWQVKSKVETDEE